MIVSLVSVFLVGLLGGVHCAGMCGGIVAVMGASARRVLPVARAAGASARVGLRLATESAATATATLAAAPAAGASPAAAVPAGPAMPRAGTLRSPLPLLLSYNAGRIASYTAAGAIAGALGSVSLLAQRVLPVEQVAFVLTNLVLVALGLYLSGVWKRITSLEVLGAALWRRLQPLASRLLGARSPAQGFAAGLVWGWVPCGMVYGVLVAAVAGGSPARGALLMASFGLGTLPNLLALGWSASRLRALIERPAFRRFAGAVVIAFGIAGLARIDPFAHLHGVLDACFDALRLR